MNIIITGCGRLGSNLALELSNLGHNISIIDHIPEHLEQLGSGFNGKTIRGVEFDTDNLLEAGINEADSLLAVHQDDNINITVSLIASRIYKVPHIIARVNDPNKKYIYDNFSISTINPVELGVKIIKNRLTMNSLDIVATLDKDYEIIELTLSKNKPFVINEIEDTYKCVISGIIKNSNIFIPQKTDIVKKGDRIICTLEKKNAEKLFSALS